MTENPDREESGTGETSTADGLARAKKDEADVSSPAKVMRIGTMVKQLLEEVRGTELDEKGRQRLAEIHRRSIDELEDGLSKELIDELERLDLPFDSADGPPTTSELRIAQAQLVGWLEGLFHGIQTAIAAQQAMAQQLAARGQLPPGMVAPGMPQPGADGQQNESSEPNRNDHGTGNYL
ncbi:proteasome activator [Brevibacterium spongiae]|uniref:proteasome activator n=1 Tax=Brevibacterium spongiae TaxID=2909672 RepID=UPI0024B5CC1A|nr:proteasome activator [Brevibacterium spongiae]